MTLRLYDSLRRATADVEPLAPGRLGLYVCGPTVYGPVHVGNARPFVVAMTLARHLRRTGWEVRVVSNLTDINDKIYAAARDEGIASRDLAEREAQHYLDDTSRLGLGRPDVEPKVTESLPGIIAMIEGLIAGGHAYASDGDVYFRVADFPSYGALSGQRIDEMQPEEITPRKEAPLDFALWKAQKEGEDAAWDSPWGPGRPGWHIECSAMAMSALGEEIDIHGGGIDLKFPHHENERAQSEALTGRPFARTWLHNGMLRFGGDKMSKSLGNIARVSDLLADGVEPRALRLALISAHYRTSLNYNEDSLPSAVSTIERLDAFESALLARAARSGEPPSGASTEGVQLSTVTRERFAAAMNDDLAVPEALAALFDFVREGNRLLDASCSAATAAAMLDTLRELDRTLGILAQPVELPAGASDLLAARAAARAARDFAESDRLRDELAARGVLVEDSRDGQRWRLGGPR